MNNIENGFESGEFFFPPIYKLVSFENRVMRIMFGIKTEEIGGK